MKLAKRATVLILLLGLVPLLMACQGDEQRRIDFKEQQNLYQTTAKELTDSGLTAVMDAKVISLDGWDCKAFGEKEFCTQKMTVYDTGARKEAADMVKSYHVNAKPEYRDPWADRIRETGNAIAKGADALKPLQYLGGGAILVSQARGNSTVMTDSQNEGGSRNKTMTRTETATATSHTTSGSHNPITNPAPEPEAGP